MLSQECLTELRTKWLPNFTDAGLDRLIDLLQKNSPLLIHGCFTKSIPMGCLATHAGWHHPDTCHLTQDAGILWMHRVAGLNPATSLVIREWDRRGMHNFEIRGDILAQFLAERAARKEQPPSERKRQRKLVPV